MKKMNTIPGTPLTRAEMKQIQGGIKQPGRNNMYKCPGFAAFCGRSTCGHTGCVVTGYCYKPVC